MLLPPARDLNSHDGHRRLPEGVCWLRWKDGSSRHRRPRQPSRPSAKCPECARRRLHMCHTEVLNGQPRSLTDASQPMIRTDVRTGQPLG
jgi:hypothetical protein